MSSLPLFASGIPGGIEMLIILLFYLLLAVGAYYLYKRLSGGSQTRVAELEDRVAELEQQIKDD